MSAKTFGVAILVSGPVGAAVRKLLLETADAVAGNYGTSFETRAIFVQLPPAGTSCGGPELGHVAAELIVSDFQQLLNDPDIDVIIEAIADAETAKEYLSEALRHGKHVVTCNQELMADHGERLVERALQHRRYFGYSAAVLGFHQFCPSLVSSIFITDLVGIFNGISNDELSKLSNPLPAVSQADDPSGLREEIVCEKGRQPDIDGTNACSRMIVAVRLAFGLFLERTDIEVKGIGGIESCDVEFARLLKMEIRLLGVARSIGDRLNAFVLPCLLPARDPLASLYGLKTGIVVRDEFRGVQQMSATGAGDAASARAVLNDLIAMSRDEDILWPAPLKSRRRLRFSRLYPPAEYYIRFFVRHAVGAVSAITRCFVRNDVNIEQILMPPVDTASGSRPEAGPVVVITSPCRPRLIEKIVEESRKHQLSEKDLVILRIESSPSDEGNTRVVDDSRDEIEESDQ